MKCIGFNSKHNFKKGDILKFKSNEPSYRKEIIVKYIKDNEPYITVIYLNNGRDFRKGKEGNWYPWRFKKITKDEAFMELL